ncbi:hypothetical protein GCM10029964_075040 [Kibdelosporangium lantanae]
MGRRTEHTYYDDGLPKKTVLKGFHNPDGSTRDFTLSENTYDGAGNPVKQVSDNGKTVVTNVIDKLGRVSSTTVDPTGLKRTNTFTYDGDGNVKSVTTTGVPSNVPWTTGNAQQKVTYDYDDSDNQIQQTVFGDTDTRVTKTSYDLRGFPVSTTDARGDQFTTRTTYDEVGQAVTTTGPAVTAETYGQQPATVNTTITTGYDTFGGETDAKDPLGHVTHTAYDRLGRAVTATQPSYQPPGGTAFTASTGTKYDGNGNIIETRDGRGNVTRRTYDQLDRLSTIDTPATANDDRAVTTFTYSRTDQVLSTVDPTGARTESTYDDFDREVTSTQVERKPAAAAYTTKTFYDDQDNVTSVVTPSGATTVNTYDTLSQLTRTVDPNNVPTDYGYDFVGQQVRATDGLGRTERSSYDLYGQKTAETSLKPDGSTIRGWSYGYDPVGNMTTSTDPLQVTTTYTYDAANRLTQQVQPVKDGKAITTSYGFDAAGNRTRFTDGRGNSTYTTYNTLGLPESTIDPATTAQPNPVDRTWTTAYDQNGNAVTMTAPGGVTRTRTFDAADRASGETGTGAEATTAAHSYGYDLAGRLTSAGGNTYVYDDRGNLFSTAGPSGTAQFRYDNDGNQVTRMDAAGSATYVYTKNRLTSVTDGVTGTATKVGYDPAGMVKTLDYGSGRVRTLGYDDLARTKTDTLANAGKQTVASTTYDYYNDDTLSAKTTTGLAGPGQQSYTYDQAGRLTASTANGTNTAYDWDDAGNRTKTGAKTSVYDERNRLQSDGDSTYTYTPRGSLKSKTTGGTTTQYAFDAFDRMASAGGQTYAYDGLDRVSSRNSTQFTYGGMSDDVVSDGTSTFARGPGDELLATATGSTKRMSLQDSHGDVVAGFDPGDGTLGAIPDSTGYGPFGAVTGKTGDTGSLGYQGDWTDQATGQVDMGARWYDPNSGGFASRDDVDTSGASTGNRYAYGAGDPVGNTDPSGHFVAPPIPKPHIHIPTPKVNWKKAFKWGWKGAKVGWRWRHFLPSPWQVAWNVLKPTEMPSDDCMDNWVPACQAILHWYPAPSVHDQFCDTHSWTSQCGGTGRMPWPGVDTDPDTGTGNGRGPGGGPGGGQTAAQRAAQAALEAYLRAKAISDAARAANDYGAKHTPIKVDPRAGKPIVLKPVSSTPDAPAGTVGTVRDVVADARQDTDRIYQAAIRAAGQVQQNVSTASQVDNDDDEPFVLRNNTRSGNDCRSKGTDPRYGDLDAANGNRATGVEICLTAETLKKGSAAQRQPPGYQWAKDYAESLGNTPSSRFINACHLLADKLGGSGTDLRNLATCSRAANATRNSTDDIGFASGHMRDIEKQVYKAVKGERQIVDYRVTPVYKGRRTVPVSFEMTAEGVYRDGTPGIHVHTVVPNMMYGVDDKNWHNIGLENSPKGKAVPYGPMK